MIRKNCNDKKSIDDAYLNISLQFHSSLLFTTLKHKPINKYKNVAIFDDIFIISHSKLWLIRLLYAVTTMASHILSSIYNQCMQTQIQNVKQIYYSWALALELYWSSSKTVPQHCVNATASMIFIVYTLSLY
jgi:hypothetical protein